MNDLISRQGAIDALKAWEEDSVWDDECLKHRGEPYWVAPSDVIERLPSAEPITLESAIDYLNDIDWLPEHDRIITESARRKSAQRKGHWILQEDKSKKHYGWHICSECGAYIGEPSKFCSECGSDMRGEENE